MVWYTAYLCIFGPVFEQCLENETTVCPGFRTDLKIGAFSPSRHGMIGIPDTKKSSMYSDDSGIKMS